MKHAFPIAAALLALACAVHGQNITAPSDKPVGGNAGTSTTESVLKKNLPPVNLQPGQPTDPSRRVTEPSRFVDLQARIAKLKSADAACPRDYHVAKAQAWLNFSRDQYHERAWQKDIQTTTFNEARRIVDALEAGQDPGLDTPCCPTHRGCAPTCGPSRRRSRPRSPAHCAARRPKPRSAKSSWSGADTRWPTWAAGGARTRTCAWPKTCAPTPRATSAS